MQISYLGTNYSGWQKQKNSKSIQETIEIFLSKILNKSVTIFGSSRTDSGVHAAMQISHFDFPEFIDCDNILRRLNSMLPNDICIKKIFQVKETFHARYSALSRLYVYKITYKKNPFFNQTHLLIHKEIDIQEMNLACEFLKFKTIDCSIFAKKNSKNEVQLCSFLDIIWEKKNEEILLYIEANRFLHGMVRCIAGYFISIANKKLTLENFIKIIQKKEKKKFPLLPQHGLTLEKIRYNENDYSLRNKIDIL